MKRKEIIEKLKIDEHNYGEFGKQYLSNSDIKTLLKKSISFVGFLREFLLSFKLVNFRLCKILSFVSSGLLKASRASGQSISQM